MYYAGGTLCIDFENPSRLIGLNLNGRGFCLETGSSEEHVTQPLHIQEKVRALYVEKKGKTRHYQEVVEAV